LRRLSLATAAVAVIVAAPAPAVAQAPPASARIVGPFTMMGVVTLAQNVFGEHVYQQTTRTWTFTPLCSVGACPTVQLVRQRATGSDTLTLSLVGPGVYLGQGLFYAPLRCAGRRYRKGEAVPFTITVQVTGAELVEGVDVATNLTATYVNAARANLTRCVDIPGHDAASYTGQLQPPPTGGAGLVSGRSPVGS
jgi:hypothetical protein